MLGGKFSDVDAGAADAGPGGDRAAGPGGGRRRVANLTAEAPETVAVSADECGRWRALLPIPVTGDTATIGLRQPAKATGRLWSSTHVFNAPRRRSPTPTRSHTKDTSTHPLEDYLNPEATEAVSCESTHQQLPRSTMGDEFGKTIMGFRGDEPDYSIAGLPWTPAVFRYASSEVKGYDPRPYVAAMLTSQTGRGSAGPKVNRPGRNCGRRPTTMTSSRRCSATASSRCRAYWCAANHLEYQVHLEP